MTRIVVDASVVFAWLLGEADPFARAKRILVALKTARMLVPAIWQVEVANVLLVKERQKRIDAAAVKGALRLLEDLPCEVDGLAATTTFDHVLPLARRNQLTTYDATYLELAIRERAPLATFDDALRAAAEREGVSLFEPTSAGE
jgi:predicted nucleic acid-binding protein